MIEDMETTTFKSLEIAGWRQFASVEIEFHPRLTVITGANGAGKSTLLNLLSSHLGVSRPYLGVPTRKSGGIVFISSIFSIARRFLGLPKRPDDDVHVNVGKLEYSNGTIAGLSVPRRGELIYSMTVSDQQQILGFHMPSHRLMPTYQRVPHLSFEGTAPAQAFEKLINETNRGYLGENTGYSALYQLKSIIASWATLGPGNEFLDKDTAQLAAYRGFVEVLRKVLPSELGFLDLKIQPPDIVMRTRSGSFMMDAASGGVIAIIETAALIYACSLRSDLQGRGFVVTFDEPENHLHPALQRTLLPTLVDAFPTVQFIIATHSPFMVSSLKDSKVYVLRYRETEVAEQEEEEEEEGQREPSSTTPESTRVESVELDYISRAGSAGEILRQVLGVTVTYPEWVELELAAIVAKYDRRPMTKETIDALQIEVREAGLEELFSEALVRLGQPK